MKNRCKKLLTLILIAALLTGCLAGIPAGRARASGKPVALNKKSMTLKIGYADVGFYHQSKKLKIKKKAGVTIKKVKYTSANNKIATVNGKGKVLAVKKGTTTVKATIVYSYLGITQKTVLKCRVKVIFPEIIRSIYLERPSYSTWVGSFTGIDPRIVGGPDELPVVYDEDGTAYIDMSAMPYTMISSDKKVAKVDKNGLVHGKKAGEAKITIKTTDGSNKKAVANVRVYETEAMCKAADDFYEHQKSEILDKIVEENNIAREDASYSLWDEMDNRQYETIERLINEASSKTSGFQNSSEKAVSALNSTLSQDSFTRETQVISDIRKKAAEISSITSIQQLLDYDAALSRDGRSGLFEADVDLVLNDENDYIYKKTIDGTDTIMDRNIYANAFTAEDDGEGDLVTSITNYIDVCLNQANSNFSYSDAVQVQAFLESVSIGLADDTVWEENNIDIDDDEAVDAFMDRMGLVAKIVPVSELDEKLKNVDLARYLQKAGCDPDGTIYIEAESALTNMDPYLTQENLELLKKVEIYQLTSEYTNLTRDGFTAENSIVLAAALLGLAAYDPSVGVVQAYREQFDQMIPSMLNWDTNRLYTDETFTEEDRVYVTEMTEQILEGYRKKIESSWLSKKAKVAAKKKIDQMDCYIICPEDYTGLIVNRDLSFLSAGGTLVSNLDVIYASDAENLRAMEGEYIHDPDKKNNAWMETYLVDDAEPLTQNAFYDVQMNTVYVFGGIVGDGSDVFTSKEPTAPENLGMLGYIIGHEIGHAFDSDGYRYDEYGHESQWFTKADVTAYEKKQEKLIDYYSSFAVWSDGESVYFNDGENTLGENMADISSFEVMLSLIDAKDYEDPIAAKRTFFESYAKLWIEEPVSNSTLNDLIFLASDVHSDGKTRTNGLCSLFDDFYKCYPVKQTSGMYVPPKNRTLIWTK